MFLDTRRKELHIRVYRKSFDSSSFSKLFKEQLLLYLKELKLTINSSRGYQKPEYTPKALKILKEEMIEYFNQKNAEFAPNNLQRNRKCS